MISLADAERRRTAFHEAAASSNLPWSFWDAHRQLGAPLSYDAGRAAKDLGRSLTEAERGCYSSHYSLWRWLLESPFEQMIVLEDDVVADWRLLEALTRIRFEGLGIEYLKLFGKVPASWRYIKSPFLGWYHHLIRFTGFPLGTQAYLMSRNAAAKMFVAGRSVEAPIDVYMDQSWRHGVLNLARTPSLYSSAISPRQLGKSACDTKLRPAVRPCYSARVASSDVSSGWHGRFMARSRQRRDGSSVPCGVPRSDLRASKTQSSCAKPP